MTEDCSKGFRGDSCFAGDDFAGDDFTSDDGGSTKEGGIFELVSNVTGSLRGCEATCGFGSVRGDEELAATIDNFDLTTACPEEGAMGDATFLDGENTS
jgi:hypothetical protein